MLTLAHAVSTVAVTGAVTRTNLHTAIDSRIIVGAHAHAAVTNSAAVASVGTFSNVASTAAPTEGAVAKSVILTISIAAADTLASNFATVTALQRTVRTHPSVRADTNFGDNVTLSVSRTIVGARRKFASNTSLSLVAVAPAERANSASRTIEGACRELAGGAGPAIVADTKRPRATAVGTAVVIAGLLGTVVAGVANVTGTETGLAIAGTVVGAHVRACGSFAEITRPGGIADTSSVAAETLSGARVAVVLAQLNRTIAASPSAVAGTAPIELAGSVFAYTSLLGTRGTCVSGIAEARAVNALSVEIAVVAAGAEGAVDTTQAGVAVAHAIVAEAVHVAVVRACSVRTLWAGVASVADTADGARPAAMPVAVGRRRRRG